MAVAVQEEKRKVQEQKQQKDQEEKPQRREITNIIFLDELKKEIKEEEPKYEEPARQM